MKLFTPLILNDSKVSVSPHHKQWIDHPQSCRCEWLLLNPYVQLFLIGSHVQLYS